MYFSKAPAFYFILYWQAIRLGMWDKYSLIAGAKLQADESQGNCPNFDNYSVYNSSKNQ